MNWTRIIEPYFSDFTPRVRDELVAALANHLPTYLTVEMQQQILDQLPEAIRQIRQMLEADIEALPSRQAAVYRRYVYDDGSIPLMNEQTSLMFTANMFVHSDILQSKVITQVMDKDLALNLWRYFRSHNIECQEKYPVLDPANFEITIDQMTAYQSIYQEIEPLFVQFIAQNRACLDFIIPFANQSNRIQIIILVKDECRFNLHMIDDVEIPAGNPFSSDKSIISIFRELN